MITVFGDLVQHRGGQISTARLGAILGRIGVEHGALRTALSRLARDGWVHSERTGRTSHYRLTAQGVGQFAPATLQIYAPPRHGPVERWAMVLKLDRSGRQIVTICPSDEVTQPADCVVDGQLRPPSDAFRAHCLSDVHRTVLNQLAKDLSALKNVEHFTPLDAAAARVLLIHRWRRIVLKYDDVPSEIMPKDSPLPDPRGAVAGMYFQLFKAAELWLDSELSGQPGLPNGNETAAARFKKAQRG